MIRTRRTRLGLWSLAAALLLAGGCQTPPHVLRERGLEDHRWGRYDQARQHFQKLHDQKPSDWMANYYLGVLALREGNIQQARNHLEVAYSLRGEGPPEHPQTPQIVDALAEALFRSGEQVQLVGFLNEAIRNYGTVRDYIRKGRYLQQMGDPDAALVTYRTAARIAGRNDAAPYVALADLYDQLGDREATVEHLRYAWWISPKDPQIAQRLEAHGIVPGPTVGRQPPAEYGD
jgi:tetratricopeptide (TPR) repeat protein